MLLLNKKNTCKAIYGINTEESPRNVCYVIKLPKLQQLLLPLKTMTTTMQNYACAQKHTLHLSQLSKL